MATTSPATAPAAPAPRSSKLLIISLVVVSLLAAGAGGYLLLGPKATAAQPAAAVVEKPIYVTVEPLTVNLQGEGRAKFLHMGMVLKMRDAQANSQLLEYMPELRSRVLLLLSNRTPDSLMSSDDRVRLAEEIRTELNRPLNDNLPAQGVVGISFNTFVVQ